MRANLINLLRVNLTPMQVLVSFLLAFALGYLWATVYRKTHSGIAYTRSFFLTLILIPPTIAMIMMAIGSNVALSLGLVGSLSIVRFRSVIKDPRDMLFLLGGIGIGLTAAANAWMVGIIGTALLALIAAVMSKIGYDQASSGDYILIFRSDQKEPWSALPSDAQKLVRWRQLRSANDVDSGKEFEYTYNIRLASKATPERIVREFAVGKIHQLSVIAPENYIEL